MENLLALEDIDISTICKGTLKIEPSRNRDGKTLKVAGVFVLTVTDSEGTITFTDKIEKERNCVVTQRNNRTLTINMPMKGVFKYLTVIFNTELERDRMYNHIQRVLDSNGTLSRFQKEENVLIAKTKHDFFLTSDVLELTPRKDSIKSLNTSSNDVNLDISISKNVNPSNNPTPTIATADTSKVATKVQSSPTSQEAPVEPDPTLVVPKEEQLPTKNLSTTPASSAAAAPPPPPPPPPPSPPSQLSSKLPDTTDARAGLMQAIRNQNGKLPLKPVATTVKSEFIPPVQTEVQHPVQDPSSQPPISSTASSQSSSKLPSTSDPHADMMKAILARKDKNTEKPTLVVQEETDHHVQNLSSQTQSTSNELTDPKLSQSSVDPNAALPVDPKEKSQDDIVKPPISDKPKRSSTNSNNETTGDVGVTVTEPTQPLSLSNPSTTGTATPNRKPLSSASVTPEDRQVVEALQALEARRRRFTSEDTESDSESWPSSQAPMETKSSEDTK